MSSNNETKIRTSNWNAMNFLKRTVRQENLVHCLERCRHQHKIRIVRKMLKRYDYTAGAVVIRRNEKVRVISPNTLGVSTTYYLMTRIMSLTALADALQSKDRARIKAAINFRINLRAKRKGA